MSSQVNSNKLAINLFKSSLSKRPLSDGKHTLSRSETPNDTKNGEETDNESLNVLAGSSKYSLDYDSSSLLDDASTRVSVRGPDGKKPFGKTFKKVYKKIFKNKGTGKQGRLVATPSTSIQPQSLSVAVKPTPTRSFIFRGELPSTKSSATSRVFKISIFAAFVSMSSLTPSSPSLIAVACLEELQERFLVD
ncbi:hypothetical protein Cantr_00234 [Candida viswanathii]|uniref:Uncharacterized protein n=1 Tax=Candida viswanathii TaxID=5486 RepID=A0A367YG98_9ASCO|nr:hypothetical protein Cantr_00234 [Candida viswanathii]